MAEKQQFNPMYRPNITSVNLTTLWGRNEEKSVAYCKMYVSGNKLRLNIGTGLTEDKAKRQPNIRMEFKDGQIPSFLAILDILRDLALHQDDGEKKTVQCPVYGYIKTREMQKAERKQIGTIQVGRTDKGIYYFTAFDGYHGKVMFPLTFERDIEVYNVNTGEPADAGWKSRCYMLSWVETMKKLIVSTLVQEFVDPDVKKDSNQSNDNRSYQSGGNNSQSNSNSGGNNNFDDFEDDFLP
jgi:hypothetical protein